MKAKHIIIAIILTSLVFYSCDRHTEEKYALTVKTLTNVFGNPFPNQPYNVVSSMIRIYGCTSFIQLDTMWIIEDGEVIGYRKIYTYPDNELVGNSSIIDTIHNVYVPAGEYILVSLYLPNYDTNGQLLYSPHFSRIGVFSDTIIFDSLSRRAGSNYENLYK